MKKIEFSNQSLLNLGEYIYRQIFFGSFSKINFYRVMNRIFLVLIVKNLLNINLIFQLNSLLCKYNRYLPTKKKNKNIKIKMVKQYVNGICNVLLRIALLKSKKMIYFFLKIQ